MGVEDDEVSLDEKPSQKSEGKEEVRGGEGLDYTKSLDHQDKGT